MSDFYLLDVIGGGASKTSAASIKAHASPARRSGFSPSRLEPDIEDQQPILRSDVLAIHPTLPVVATGAGCMLIVWDLRSDRKTSLIRHTSPLTKIAFLSETLLPGNLAFFDPDAKPDALIISVDSGLSPTFCLWNWQTAHLLKHSYLPLKPSPRHLPIANTLLGLTRARSLVLGGRASVDLNPLSPQFSHAPPTLFADDPRSSKTVATSLALILENESIEQRGYRLSVWSLGGDDSSTSTEQKPQSMDLMKLQFVSELEGSETALDMCVIATSEYSCFVTVETRCIKFWELAGTHAVKLRKRVHIKQEVLRVASDNLTGFVVVLSRGGKILVLDAQGNYVSTIEKDNIKFTAVACEQAQQLMLGTSKGAVQIYNLASLRYVREVEYPLELKQRYKLKWQIKMKGTNSRSLAGGHEELMMRVSGGPGVRAIFPSIGYMLIFYEDGATSIYHRPGCSHLRYTSSHNGGVAQLKWLPSSATSAGHFLTVSHDLTLRIWKHFGDRWTSSYIDIATAIDSSLQHFGSHAPAQPARPHELHLKAVAAHPKQNYIICGDDRGVLRSFSLESGELLLTRDVSSFAVTCMAFSQDGELLVVAHSTGLVNVYETATSFAFLMQLEQHFDDATGEQFFQTVLLHSRSKNAESQFYNTIQSNQYKFNTIGAVSDISDFGSAVAHQAFTLHNSTTVRSYALLRHLAKRVSAQLLMEFQVKQGIVSGLSLHPSGDYIILLSNAGFFLIYRSDTAELRGRVDVPEFSRSCAIDPSGLYLVLSAPQPQTSGTGEVMNDASISGVEFAPPESSINCTESSRLLIFEIGTGNFCTQLTSLFKVTAFQWSKDGRFMAVAGEQGIVSVWGVANSLSENIFRVLDAMRLDPAFWTTYPIYLDNCDALIGPQNEIVTQIDLSAKPKEHLRFSQEKGVLTSPRFDHPLEPRSAAAKRYEVAPDERSVKSVHSMRDDVSRQQLEIYHRGGAPPPPREEPRSTNRSHIGSMHSQGQKEQSRFVKVATPMRGPASVHSGGVGVQTSERYFEKATPEKRENFTEMARRFTRQITPSRHRASPALNLSSKIYKNEKYSPRSAVSAVVSKGFQNPLVREGLETKSVSHRPQNPASQMTPRTLEPSFFVANQARSQPSMRAPQPPPPRPPTRQIQKRRYGSPGRDLLDKTDAKELYPKLRGHGHGHGAQHQQDHAISTLLDKPLSSLPTEPQQLANTYSRINNTRKIKPDPSDIDEDVGPAPFEQTVTYISPLAAPGIPRPPQQKSGPGQAALRAPVQEENKQVIEAGGAVIEDRSQTPEYMSHLAYQPVSYELGVGQSLQNIKNFDPLLGHAITNHGLESSNRSTAGVVEQLYSDLDAFEMANMPESERSEDL